MIPIAISECGRKRESTEKITERFLKNDKIIAASLSDSSKTSGLIEDLFRGGYKILFKQLCAEIQFCDERSKNVGFKSFL